LISQPLSIPGASQRLLYAPSDPSRPPLHPLRRPRVRPDASGPPGRILTADLDSAGRLGAGRGGDAYGRSPSRVNVPRCPQALPPRVCASSTQPRRRAPHSRTGVITVGRRRTPLYAHPASGDPGLQARAVARPRDWPELPRAGAGILGPPSTVHGTAGCAPERGRSDRSIVRSHLPDRRSSTTTLDCPVGARPRVSAIFINRISDSKRLYGACTARRAGSSGGELSCELPLDYIRWPPFEGSSSSWQIVPAPIPDENSLANLICARKRPAVAPALGVPRLSRVRVTMRRHVSAPGGGSAILLVRDTPIVPRREYPAREADPRRWNAMILVAPRRSRTWCSTPSPAAGARGRPSNATELAAANELQGVRRQSRTRWPARQRPGPVIPA